MTGQSLYDNFLFCRDEMSARFSLSELATLCQDVGIAADRLDHRTVDELAAALLRWAYGNDQRGTLLDHLRQQRPTVSWPDDYTTKVDTHAPIDRWPPPGILADPSRLLPPGSRLIFERNPLFTGRESELLDLSGLLRPDRAATSPVVIATGIGGVGKTQLATEFVYRYGRFFAGGAQWIALEGDDDAIRSQIVDCGAALGLYDVTDTTLTSEQKAARVREAWRALKARLLVFDNCEDPALLDRYAPPPGGGARVLVTSRNDDWPAGFARLPVPTLPRDESQSLLREYLERADPPRRESDADLDAVAEELGDLPLALILAGSYLATYPNVAVAGYLAELRRPGLLAHVSLRNKAGEASWTKHDMDVGRTFAVSVARLRPDNSETDAVAVLILIGATCLVHGTPFPRELLTGMIKNDDPHLADDALGRLFALGLLERSGGQLRLHRLITRFVAEYALQNMDSARPSTREGQSTQEEEVMVVARAAVERAVISLAYKHNLAGDPRALWAWKDHLRHVTDAASEREDDTAATLCNNLGYYLQMAGDLAGARSYYERALAIHECILGPEHSDTGMSASNLAGMLEAFGQYSDALPLRKRALEIHLTIFGENHPITATSLNNLGLLLKVQGDLAGARPYYERALTIDEKILGAEHPDTATDYNNMGALLWAQGDLAGARPYYEHTLAIHERVFDPEHPQTAMSLNNLGMLLQDMGDLAEARPYLERALAIRERVLGPEHPHTAQSLINLGGLLRAQGDLVGARPYLERALTIDEKILGAEHPDTATDYNNMGVLLRAQGDLAGAQPYFERTLAIRKRVFGLEHPATATSLNNLGMLLQDMDNLAEARPFTERALAIRERVLGPEHPDTAMSLNNLGGLLKTQGDLTGARTYLECALTILEAKLGPDHPNTRTVRGNLATLAPASE